MKHKHIESRDNPTLKALKKLCDSGRARHREGLFVVCGESYLLAEALVAGAAVDSVVCTMETSAALMLPDDATLITLPEPLLSGLLPLESSAPLLFTCHLPDRQLSAEALQTGRHLVLDGLQDPGNVGTLLRTAAAFGFASVICTEGCADPYSPKVTRAAAGALFSLNVHSLPRQQLADMITQAAVGCWAAAHEQSAVCPETLKGQTGLLIVGGEAAGVSRELRAVSTAVVSIDMHGDSLNAAVAGAILMYHMR